MTTVGFVGATGLMGHGMAKNIARAGMSLSYTLRSESQRVEDLDGLGARQAPGIAALGRDCDVVVICVTSSADVEEVVDSLLEEPREGLVIVDSSTSEPTSTMKLSERARAQGVGHVDAPLTKGPAAAEAGDLNVMVGGAEADVARVLPVLEAFAGSVLRTGDVGTAHTLKLVNNTVIQAFCNALAEGFTVAGKAGLDPRLVHEILGRGGMNAPFLHAIAGALDGDHSGMEFHIDNARKDVRYYSRLAGDLGVVAPMGSAAHQSLATASALGFGQESVPALVQAQAKLNNVEPPRTS